MPDAWFEAIEDYWMFNADLAERLDLQGQLHRCVPYRLYGDGADSHRGQHFEICTILPVLGGGKSTYDTRLLLSVRNTVLTTDEARTMIHERIAWSCECLRPCVASKFYFGDAVFSAAVCVAALFEELAVTQTAIHGDACSRPATIHTWRAKLIPLFVMAGN